MPSLNFEAMSNLTLNNSTYVDKFSIRDPNVEYLSVRLCYDISHQYSCFSKALNFKFYKIEIKLSSQKVLLIIFVPVKIFLHDIGIIKDLRSADNCKLQYNWQL